MKLTLRIGAAMGIVALAGCSQGGQDNTDAADMNAGYANESVMPTDENAMGTDTLGNQMNQLNETDGAMSNATDTGNMDMSNSTGNTTNTE